MGEPERADLEHRYRRLVLRELPRLAVAGRWVVRADHCFGRIVLDHTVGGCWYDVLDRRRGPAFRQLDDDQLRSAVGRPPRVPPQGAPVVRRRHPQRGGGRGE